MEFAQFTPIQLAFLLAGPVLAVAYLAYLSWRTGKLTVDGGRGDVAPVAEAPSTVATSRAAASGGETVAPTGANDWDDFIDRVDAALNLKVEETQREQARQHDRLVALSREHDVGDGNEHLSILLVQDGKVLGASPLPPILPVGEATAAYKERGLVEIPKGATASPPATTNRPKRKRASVKEPSVGTVKG